MRTRLVVGLAFGALGIVVSACSSSSSSTAPPPPDSTVAEFCSDWATAICQLSTFCQFDATVCATNQTTVCNTFATNATASGNRQYSQPAGLACVTALKSAYGGNPSVISAAALAQLDATCNAAFVGSVASDKPCTSDYDCASGLTCSLIPGQSTSVCGANSPVAAGGTCLATAQCPANYYCAPVMGAEPQCTATPTTGGACSGAIPCGADDFCGSSGTCQAKATVGQSCSSSDDCAASAPYCDLYPPAACTTGLTFARGSIDCNGIAGLDTTDAGGGTTPEAGATDSGAAGD